MVVVLCGIHPATDQRQILPRPIKIVELTSWDDSRAAAEKRIMNKAKRGGGREIQIIGPAPGRRKVNNHRNAGCRVFSNVLIMIKFIIKL